MNKTQVLVFDFDNCLVLNQETGEGSEELKDNAWLEVFSEYDQDVLKKLYRIAKNDFAGGKGDRKDLVARISAHFGVEDSKLKEDNVKRLNHFDEIVQRGIQKMGISKKTRDFLSVFSSKNSIYLNTATPIENVLTSLDLLDIKKFFKGIYGRPGTKLENLKAILDSESANPYDVIFIDDQESSYQIAKEIGCKFIGICTTRNKKWHGNPQPFPVIRSIDEITNLII